MSHLVPGHHLGNKAQGNFGDLSDSTLGIWRHVLHPACSYPCGFRFMRAMYVCPTPGGQRLEMTCPKSQPPGPTAASHPPHQLQDSCFCHLGLQRLSQGCPSGWLAGLWLWFSRNLLETHPFPGLPPQCLLSIFLGVKQDGVSFWITSPGPTRHHPPHHLCIRLPLTPPHRQGVGDAKCHGHLSLPCSAGLQGPGELC